MARQMHSTGKYASIMTSVANIETKMGQEHVNVPVPYQLGISSEFSMKASGQLYFQIDDAIFMTIVYIR